MSSNDTKIRPASPAVLDKKTTGGRIRALGRRIWSFRESYTLILPGAVWYAVFAYLPMYGLLLAFKTYKAKLGIFGSPWVGLENYVYVFRDISFMQAVLRTLQINAGRLLFQFPVPIILAMLFNEIRLGKSKKVLQSVFTFPHFLSWVIVASVLTNVLSMNGMANAIIKIFGGDGINFLGS
ncbi:MAG: sugar ABC transporter permease, partial [Oscillospiraceae bacterium]|nr:sugar ABC transporter permease [Oscillospiraceae bacterium]